MLNARYWVNSLPQAPYLLTGTSKFGTSIARGFAKEQRQQLIFDKLRLWRWWCIIHPLGFIISRKCHNAILIGYSGTSERRAPPPRVSRNVHTDNACKLTPIRLNEDVPPSVWQVQITRAWQIPILKAATTCYFHLDSGSNVTVFPQGGNVSRRKLADYSTAVFLSIVSPVAITTHFSLCNIFQFYFVKYILNSSFLFKFIVLVRSGKKKPISFNNENKMKLRSVFYTGVAPVSLNLIWSR